MIKNILISEKPDFVAITGDTVSANIENGLIDNIVIYFLPRSVVFSTLIIVDQPLYLGQLVTAS